MPLLLAPQVVALAWLQMFGPSSPLLKLLGIAPALGSRNPLYSPGGIILVLGVQYAPLVFLTLARRVAHAAAGADRGGPCRRRRGR